MQLRGGGVGEHVWGTWVMKVEGYIISFHKLLPFEAFSLMFIMDEKWWMKSIHYRWSMDDDNDLNHLRSGDLDIHRCISLCGWNGIIFKWISSMDNKLDDIWTSKNCMNYHVKYTIFVIKNYEYFIDVLDYVRIR